MVEKVPMTAVGHAALTDELKHRQSVDRPRIVEQIAEARSHGDLSENAEYHAAKEEQSIMRAASPNSRTSSRVPISSISRNCPATPSSSAPPSRWSTRIPRR